MSNELLYPRRNFLKGCLASASALVLGGRLLAANPNEREVKPEANALDIDKIGKDTNLWVLDFRFKDPRVIKVDVPARGQKVCWYLWYQVINNSGKPQFFNPEFDWVTLDQKTIHHDQILPRVQEDIRKIEDPNNYLKIKLGDHRSHRHSAVARMLIPSPSQASPSGTTSTRTRTFSASLFRVYPTAGR